MKTDSTTSSYRRMGVLASFFILSVACGADDMGPSYAYVDFTEPSKPPAEVTLTPDFVSLPVGIAVRVTPVAMGDDEWPLRGEVADTSLVSVDRSILDVLPGPEEGQLVLVGAGVGATSLRVLIQGVQVDSLSVQVVSQ
jgi:hypothetical protein